MSYDISIDIPEHDKCCPHCDGVVGRVERVSFAYWDPTYNYGPMFRAALGNDTGIHAWNGKTVSEVAPELLRMVEALLADPAKFRALNPPNGWGTYDDLVPFLRDNVLPRFREAPASAVVTVT